ncbi:GNAT family N-acetyltransferase [Paenibacillus kandeliae]|uniref:GNAT family N-acetyltransferase n=1 Tax=Paenibacillus kandeliae TaxID=3231269 RepID=UPI00345AA7F4
MPIRSVSDITLRLSTMKDAKQLMQLDQLVWNHLNTPSVFYCTTRREYLQACPPGSQLLAVQDHIICGYVGFACPQSFAVSRHVYDIHIAVHPDYRRLGIGVQLLDALCRYAKQQGIRKLTLRVLSTNEEAVHFYDKYGFVENGRLQEQFYIHGQYVDDILMTYWL